MLPALMTRRVSLSDLFQLYKSARICHHNLFRDGFSTTFYTRRPLHLRRSIRRSHQGTTFRLHEWRKMVICRSDSTRRVIISLWSNLLGLVFYRSSCLPTVNIVAERLPGLVEAICRIEIFVRRYEDKVFRINCTGSYRIARFTHDKNWISIEVHGLRTLQYIFRMITNTLVMYTGIGQCSRLCKGRNGLFSYVEGTPTASKSYIQLSLVGVTCVLPTFVSIKFEFAYSRVFLYTLFL